MAQDHTDQEPVPGNDPRVPSPVAGQTLAYPFLRREFLSALEETGAVGGVTGWEPLHQLDDNCVWPLYRKWHSMGEYVFDQGWAAGYERAGLRYYPRLITAIPFTPVPGPRWRGDCADPAARVDRLLREEVADRGASGWHLLFPDSATRDALRELPLVERLGCHFHWVNRGYADFDGFLAALMSRKRKNLRRERRKVAGQGVVVDRAVGVDIPQGWWRHFYQCYALTYLRRGQRPYLCPEFFKRLFATMPEQLMMVTASRHGELLAAALYLFDSERLYGRYWGTLEDLDGLHFELCYYQGIEFCIERGLTEFDPGVQGEHKLLRGFEPRITHSLHWLADLRFHAAVEQFCNDEARAVSQYLEQARSHLPYRRGT